MKLENGMRFRHLIAKTTYTILDRSKRICSFESIDGRGGETFYSHGSFIDQHDFEFLGFKEDNFTKLYLTLKND